jgi:asparagine synthase (glutamine-hydrolysing)
MTGHGFRATLYGAGGDEVFAGYAIDYFQPYLRYLLKQGRGLRFAKEFLLFSQHRPGRLGFDYFRRASQLLLPGVMRALPWAPRLYHGLVKDRLQPACDPFVSPNGVSAHAGPSDNIDQRMIDYMSHWLMNYWLRIDNQNSMGVPLELRLPFLDYRVVEFGFTLPLEFLIRDG